MIESLILIGVAILLLAHARGEEGESTLSICFLSALLISASIWLAISFDFVFQLTIVLALVAIHPWVISVLVGWRQPPKVLLLSLTTFSFFVVLNYLAALSTGFDPFEAIVRALAFLAPFILFPALLGVSRAELFRGIASWAAGAMSIIAPTVTFTDYFIKGGLFYFVTWIYLAASLSLSLYVTARMLISDEFTRVILSVPENVSIKEPNEFERKFTHIAAIFLLLFAASDLGVSIYLVAAEGINSLFPNAVPTDPAVAPRAILLLVLGSVLPSIATLEVMRVRRKLIFYSKSLLRKKELDRVASYFYTISAMFILAVFFPFEVTLYAMTIALLADAASAIIGKRYGRHILVPGRSLEGLASGFFMTVFVTPLFNFPLSIGIYIAFLLSIADIASSLDINDNILFPVTVALAASLI